MYFNLSILEFSADKPHGYQFLYPLPLFFHLQLLPLTQKQRSWIPPLEGEKKKKKKKKSPEKAAEYCIRDCTG